MGRHLSTLAEGAGDQRVFAAREHLRSIKYKPSYFILYTLEFVRLENTVAGEGSLEIELEPEQLKSSLPRGGDVFNDLINTGGLAQRRVVFCNWRFSSRG